MGPDVLHTILGEAERAMNFGMPQETDHIKYGDLLAQQFFCFFLERLDIVFFKHFEQLQPHLDLPRIIHLPDSLKSNSLAYDGEPEALQQSS